MKNGLSRVFAMCVAVLALTGDALLLRIQMSHDHTGVLHGIATDTIFFSDLSNLFIAIVFLLVAGQVASRKRPWLIGCSLVAVLLTFLGSNGWLGFVRPLSGNTLVHTWTPLCAALWCVCFGRKGRLRWSFIVSWTLTCLAYVPYVFLRGWLTGRYPYPWLDPQKTSGASILQNVLLQALTFVAVSFAVVLTDRIWIRTTKRKDVVDLSERSA